MGTNLSSVTATKTRLDSSQSHLQQLPNSEFRHVSSVSPAHRPVSVIAVGEAAANVDVVEDVDLEDMTGLTEVDVCFTLFVLDEAATNDFEVIVEIKGTMIGDITDLLEAGDTVCDVALNEEDRDVTVEDETNPADDVETLVEDLEVLAELLALL